MATVISSSSTVPAPSESKTLRDASFFSYLNSSEEDYIRALAQSALNLRISKQPHYDVMRKNKNKPKPKGREIDIFGAERYFNQSTLEPNTKGTLVNPSPNKHRHQRINLEDDAPQKGTIEGQQVQSPGCQSESSWNSQSALLRQIPRAPSRGSNSNNKKKNNSKVNKGQGFRKLFLPCYNCCSINSAVIDKQAQNKNSREPEAAALRRVAVASDSMLSWDAIPIPRPTTDQEEDRFSDASSDLFELDCQLGSYAPSEASIDWSVVTADFEELDQQRSTTRVTPKKSNLLESMSHKAVRVAAELMHKAVKTNKSKSKSKYAAEAKFDGQKQSSPRWSHSSHASELFYIH